MLPGLVSITFRKLSPLEVVALAADAGLQGIEWGGDIHVPHGDLQRAREVCRMTEDAGLRVAAYGSYYYVGDETAGGRSQPPVAVTSADKRNDGEHAVNHVRGVPPRANANAPDPKTTPLAFDQVLATAVELGAPTIRVWAGRKSSASADADYRAHIAGESRRIAALAAAEGITISYEFHGGTLTDTGPSAGALLLDVEKLRLASSMKTCPSTPSGLPTENRKLKTENSPVPSIRSYWQPAVGQTDATRLASLETVLPYLTNIHVFHWGPKGERLPLSEGGAFWRSAFRAVEPHPSPETCFALLEFVTGDAPELLAREAATLRQLLGTPPQIPGGWPQHPMNERVQSEPRPLADKPFA